MTSSDVGMKFHYADEIDDSGSRFVTLPDQSFESSSELIPVISSPVSRFSAHSPYFLSPKSSFSAFINPVNFRHLDPLPHSAIFRPLEDPPIINLRTSDSGFIPSKSLNSSGILTKNNSARTSLTSNPRVTNSANTSEKKKVSLPDCWEDEKSVLLDRIKLLENKNNDLKSSVEQKLSRVSRDSDKNTDKEKDKDKKKDKKDKKDKKKEKEKEKKDKKKEKENKDEEKKKTKLIDLYLSSVSSGKSVKKNNYPEAERKYVGDLKLRIVSYSVKKKLQHRQTYCRVRFDENEKLTEENEGIEVRLNKEFTWKVHPLAREKAVYIEMVEKRMGDADCCFGNIKLTIKRFADSDLGENVTVDIYGTSDEEEDTIVAEMFLDLYYRAGQNGWVDPISKRII